MKSSFGDKLQALRLSRAISMQSLDSSMALSRRTVSRWELGQGETPDRPTVLQLARVLRINKEQTNELLRTLEYSEITDKESHLFLEQLLTPTDNPEKVDPSKQMQAQVSDIETIIESMDTKNFSVEQKNTQHKLLQTINSLEEISKQITVPIRLPSIEDLTIDLVPATLVYELDEIKNKERTALAISSTLFSLAVGLSIEWINSNTASQLSVIIFIVTVVLLIPSVIIYLILRSKSKKAKAKVLKRNKS